MEKGNFSFEIHYLSEYFIYGGTFSADYIVILISAIYR